MQKSNPTACLKMDFDHLHEELICAFSTQMSLLNRDMRGVLETASTPGYVWFDLDM